MKTDKGGYPVNCSRLGVTFDQVDKIHNYLVKEKNSKFCPFRDITKANIVSSEIHVKICLALIKLQFGLAKASLNPDAISNVTLEQARPKPAPASRPSLASNSFRPPAFTPPLAKRYF